MSKLSFRARQLDAYKAMPIYRAEEIPELADVAAINRAVPQMPTGMEKEEETEHHLQRALSAQQVYGTSEALVIPVPDIDDVRREYEHTYPTDYKTPKQYIHAQPLGVDQEIPDYDIDSEDEAWLEGQSKKIELTANKFEEMIDRLEKGSGQQVVELKDAKVLLKEDDDLIITVYDYWLNKRLKSSALALIPSVKSEKRDGSTTNNPYVAFRRRTEKMQTRKNRKNDEVSYEKMLKLRRDLQRAVTVLEMIKKREKCKKELLQLTIEILDKRYDMEDYMGTNMAYAESQKAPRPVFYPLYHDQYSKEGESRKLKRKYEKKKHKSGSSGSGPPTGYHNTGGEVVDVMEYGSTEDEPLSPVVSQSDNEEESHPDGIYAFRRNKLCSYHAPLDTCGNWAWASQQSGGHSDKRYRYTLTSIDTGPESRKVMGYARRRRGRGGRVIFDRALSEQRIGFWDQAFEATVPEKSVSQSEVEKRLQKAKDDEFSPIPDLTSNPQLPQFRDFVSEQKWLHFTPMEEYDSTNALFSGALLDELSSEDLNDTVDPIIDIIPDNTIPQGYTPAVTSNSLAPSAENMLLDSPSLCEPLLAVTDTATLAKSNTITSHLQVTEKSDSISGTSSSPQASIIDIESEFEFHQKRLHALKKDFQDQHASKTTPPASPGVTSSTQAGIIRTTIASAPTIVSSTTKIIAQSQTNSTSLLSNMNNISSVSQAVNHMVDSGKATFAMSALVNGQTVRGNGIKHLNGPSTKVEIKHEVNTSTCGPNSVNSLRKVNFPLTPSSDTSETTTSLVSDLIHITSVPGESGDSVSSSQMLQSEKDFTDSAGLNSLPDVGSTMEVS